MLSLGVLGWQMQINVVFVRHEHVIFQETKQHPLFIYYDLLESICLKISTFSSARYPKIYL